MEPEKDQEQQLYELATQAVKDGELVSDRVRYTVSPEGKITISIAIDPDGLPRVTCTVPMPGTTEEERRERISAVQQSYVMGGYWIVKSRMIRNRLFDKRDERTTLTITIRPCRNTKEALALSQQIRYFIRQAKEEMERDGGEPATTDQPEAPE